MDLYIGFFKALCNHCLFLAFYIEVQYNPSINVPIENLGTHINGPLPIVGDSITYECSLYLQDNTSKLRYYLEDTTLVKEQTNIPGERVMPYTVADALALGVFKEAKVVAGESKLSNVITNAEVMETPLMSKRMHGGEFVLCSGYAFRSAPALQVKVIEQFAKKGISVFGIQVGRYFDEIPQCMIEAAERVQLPLLELPPNYSYMEFLMPFYEMIVEKQMQPLNYTEKLHARMIKTMLSGNGIEGIVALTFSQINCPMILLDMYGNVCYCKQDYWKEKNPFSYADAMYKALQKMEKSSPFEVGEIRGIDLENDGERGVCMKLDAGGTALGYLIMDSDYSSLSKLHRTIIGEAGSFLSLELLKEKAVVEAEQDARSSLLEDIIDGNYRDERSVLRRGNYLNIDLRGRYVLCFLSFDEAEGEHQDGKDNDSWMQNAKFIHHLCQQLDLVNENYLLKFEDNGLLMLHALGDGLDLDEFYNGLCGVTQNAQRVLDGKGKLRLCIGDEQNNMEGLQYNCVDIKKAVSIANYFGLSQSIVRYKDIELLLLLSKLRDDPIVKNHIERYMLPILQYDEKFGTELEKTLSEYFRNEKSVSGTAAVLYLHKNTVQYRLKRISEIAQLDLNQHKDSFMLEICMLLKQIADVELV